MSSSGARRSHRGRAVSPPSARRSNARSTSPIRSTCSSTQRPSQRPPCRRERSKNAWRSSSVYCRRRGFLGLLWTVPPVISPCLTAGHRSEMWLGNRSARTRAPQFSHTERESTALSAAFSTMRRFHSLSRAFSRCSRAISATISCVVTFAYSGMPLGPDQAGGSVGPQQPAFSRFAITESPLVETSNRRVAAELPPAAPCQLRAAEQGQDLVALWWPVLLGNFCLGVARG